MVPFTLEFLGRLFIRCQVTPLFMAATESLFMEWSQFARFQAICTQTDANTPDNSIAQKRLYEYKYKYCTEYVQYTRTLLVVCTRMQR